MKQSILPTIAGLALLLVATPAGAQGLGQNIMGEVRVETQAEVQSNREEARMNSAEVRTSADERKASSTEKRIEIHASIAKRLAANTARVLTATVERLEQIAVRIESRIEKMKASGATTTESEVAVAEAKSELDEAQNSIDLFASIELDGETSSMYATWLEKWKNTSALHMKA